MASGCFEALRPLGSFLFFRDLLYEREGMSPPKEEVRTDKLVKLGKPSVDIVLTNSPRVKTTKHSSFLKAEPQGHPII